MAHVFVINFVLESEIFSSDSWIYYNNMYWCNHIIIYLRNKKKKFEVWGIDYFINGYFLSIQCLRSLV